MLKSKEENASITSPHSKTSTNHFTTKDLKTQNKSPSISSSQEKIISVMSEILSYICEEGKSNIDYHNPLYKFFFFKEVPPYSIKEYLERLVKHTKVNESTIIMILIYIDRLCGMKNINLNYNIIHKLILASFVCAIKYNEDLDNLIGFYAKLGGVSKTEMNHLVYIFLRLLDHNLFVDSELFEKYKEDLLNCDAKDEEEDDENDNNDNDNNEEDDGKVINNNENNK